MSNPPFRSEGYIDLAKKYMESHIKDVKIRDVADYLCLDRSYFSSIFKTTTGTSPSSFLLTLKMETACQMLVESDEKIGDIAGKVGYENPLTFSKMFRMKMGICPREYRRLHRISPN